MLPLFPLKMVVFPGQALNLHVFEPRYKQLVAECEANGTTFGIPAFLDRKVADVGTEIRLVRIAKRYPKGELDIETEAVGLFRIEAFYEQAPNRLYPGGEVQRMELDAQADPVLTEEIREKVSELYDQLQMSKGLPEEQNAFTPFNVGHSIGLSLEQEYELLCLSEEIARQRYVIEHLTKLLPEVKKREALKRKIQMNGHFKNVIPPDIK